MEIVSIVNEGLGNSSYVVDLGDGGALVVDPERDPRRYLEELERRSLRPRFVVETHLHADFVSGGGELLGAGAALWAPADSDLTLPHRPLVDSDELDLGGLTWQVIATPGHTPEHLAYLLLDGSQPLALFSGGTLMAGGVARTDLLTPEQTEPLARAAYRSIRERLLILPDDLQVYPTHGAGSFCAVGAGGERTTTIGREKASNPLLAGDPDEDTFVERLLGGYGTYPPYFLELREVNRRGPAVYGTAPPVLAALSVTEVDASIDEGADLIDVRPVEAFAAGHIPGSLSIPWRDQFATWLGWLIPRTAQLVFVVGDEIDRADLVWAARTIGYENIVGELDGGMAAWESAGRPIEQIPMLHPGDVGDRRVVDVRQADEYAAGHLREATSRELGALVEPGTDLPDEPLLIHCGHGERAMTAASVLRLKGHHDVAVFRGRPGDLGDLVTET